MNDLEIRRVVYGLLQAGLVEIVRPGGRRRCPLRHGFPTDNNERTKIIGEPVDQPDPFDIILLPRMLNYADGKNRGNRSLLLR